MCSFGVVASKEEEDVEESDAILTGPHQKQIFDPMHIEEDSFNS